MLTNAGNARMLVIGLDSITFRVLQPMLAQNKLPNIQRLMASGVSSELRSTIPPLSPAAWVTTMTGMNPGGHGVFDFRTLDFSRPKGRTDEPVRSSHFSGLTIFDFLSQQGLKAGAFNIPLTYPAWPINGVMVSGPITPDMRVPYTYPPELGREIGPMARYSQVADLKARDLDANLEELVWRTKKHFAYGRNLLQDHGVFDLFWFHLHTTDSVQHRFWQYADFGEGPLTPGKESYANAIETIYSLADQGIGELLEEIGPDSNVLILSDHGARGRGLTRLQPNFWLREHGYLRISKPNLFEKYRQSLKRKLGNHNQSLLENPTGKPLGFLPDTLPQAFFLPMIEPVGGIVMSSCENSGIDGYDYEKTRDRIIHDLRAWTDPAAGEPIVKKIWKREALYSGPFEKNAPDILFLVDSRYHFDSNINGPLFHPIKEFSKELWSGIHDMMGVLIANGPSVVSGEGPEDAELADIAPTLLTILGLPVPSNMNGRVLEGIVSSKQMKLHEVRYTDPLKAGSNEKQADSEADDDSAAMIGHLRALGYIE